MRLWYKVFACPIFSKALMLDPSKFMLFVAVSWALILAPGPDMLYVITRGMTHGRRAGILSAVGVICGILVHTTAAALGITLIFQTSALAFLIVKYLGALYLIYLGVKAWRDNTAFDLRASASIPGSRSLLWQGMLSNLLNPKIAVFFLAFLPQFVEKGNGQVPLQMVMLGLTFAFFGLCFLALIGYSPGTAGKWLAGRPEYTRLSQRLAGGILIGLGLRLALFERK